MGTAVFQELAERPAIPYDQDFLERMLGALDRLFVGEDSAGFPIWKTGRAETPLRACCPVLGENVAGEGIAESPSNSDRAFGLVFDVVSGTSAKVGGGAAAVVFFSWADE